MLDGCTPWPQDFVRRYIKEGVWDLQSIPDLLDEAARAHAGRRLIADGPRHFTYQEVSALADRLAFRFLERGLKPRDVVLLQLPNIWEFVVVFFALQKIGVVPVMCLPPHRHTELAYFAQLTGARGYIFTPRFRNFDYLTMARELHTAAPALEYLVAAGDGGEPGVSYLAPWLDEPPKAADLTAVLASYRPAAFDVAFFLLSGGTTGVPKLIPRTHADYIYNAMVCAQVLGWGPETVFMVVIPAAHNFPLGAPGMIGALSVGGSVAMSPSPDPEVICDAIEKARGTVLAVSPALLISLLNWPHKGRYDLTSLRFVCAGGQKMLPELVDRTWSTWPHATPGHAFGMAEGLINLTRVDDPREVIRETQGRPISPFDEIKIVGDDGGEVQPGEVGELLTRGPYTIRGYYRAEEHNRVAFTADGFYRTGDMVRLHPTGNLVVEGRRKDMINRGGEKISAEEVENLILSHPSVHMAAVVAMPDAVMGERGCAFVVPKDGRNLSFEELSGFLLSKRIAKFKLPERLEIVSSFPLTGVGKVSKKDLREQIATKLKAEAKP